MTEVSQLPLDSRVPAHPPGFLTPPGMRLDVFRRHRCWAPSMHPLSPQGQASISRGCSPSAEITSVTQKGPRNPSLNPHSGQLSDVSLSQSQSRAFPAEKPSVTPQCLYTHAPPALRANQTPQSPDPAHLSNFISRGQVSSAAGQARHTFSSAMKTRRITALSLWGRCEREVRKVCPGARGTELVLPGLPSWSAQPG